MSYTNLLRLGGLAAVLGGLLVMIFVLVFLVFQGPLTSSTLAATVFETLDALSRFGQVVMLLGLIGLYIRQSQAVGTLGLTAFVAAFLGSVLMPVLFWAGSLAYLGWAVFGVASLQAQVYPRVASVFLIVSALVTEVVASYEILPLPIGPGDVLGYLGSVAFLVFNGVISWLGFTLFWETSARL